MKVSGIIIKFITGFCIFIVALLTFQYVLTPKYTFPEPHAFHGEYIYNPYRNADMNKWRMANFHAHLWKFFGHTVETSKSLPLFDSLYRSFNYDIISISDYQTINLYESKHKWFVPVYEHGFQYYKNHQLVLNANKVDWMDLPFRQTLSNKQFIIDRLKKDTSALVTIVHPAYRKAYSQNDFRYLANYNCLEIANHERLFTSFYDTVLSNGHPVFIMADDDGHEIKDSKDICSSFNLVNSGLVKDSILKALRTGCSVGVKFNISSFNTNEEKKAALLKLPKLKTITFNNDTFTVGLSQPVKAIKFIGQHGLEKIRISDSQEGKYLFNNQDTYIRTEIECYDGTVYFLNPLFRYDGKRLPDYIPELNVFKTWAWRLAFLCLLLLIFFIWHHKNV